MEINDSKIVVFAAGGGNDIFSTIAYIKNVTLKNYRAENIFIMSLLGLTPFHYPSELEDGITYTEPMIIEPTENMSRYIVSNPPIKIKCMESLVGKVVSDIVPGLTKIICISTKYSIEEQCKKLQEKFLSWDMNSTNTEISLVDFGGDILTNGEQDSIISPELDAYSLTLVMELSHRYGYKSTVNVCFPGVDGELDKEYMVKRCNEAKTKVPIDRDGWLNTLNRIYGYLKDVRPGNTIPNMISILSDPSVNSITVRKQWKIFDGMISYSKLMKIDPDLQRYIHVFNLKSMLSNPYKLCVLTPGSYCLLNVLLAIIFIYNRQKKTNNRFQSSDIFLQFLRRDLMGKYTNKNLRLDDMECDIVFVDIYPGYMSEKEKNVIENSILDRLIETPNMTRYSNM